MDGLNAETWILDKRQKEIDLNWVALSLWVGIPVLVIAGFWASSRGSSGVLGLFFSQVFLILGFVNTLTGATDLVTNRPETYYRRVDDYLFEVRFGVIALFIGILIAVYPFLPLVKKERERKDSQARKIHEQYNAVHKGIGDRGYGWRNKRRMLAGKEPIAPLETTIVIIVMVVIVIWLATLFTSSVFG